jgi:hypothetical protein
MKKSEIFKSKFPEFVGAVDFYTSDCEQLNFIDVESDIVEYIISVVKSCECCSEYEFQTSKLNHIMDYMSDVEFEELCDEVAKRI